MRGKSNQIYYLISDLLVFYVIFDTEAMAIFYHSFNNWNNFTSSIIYLDFFNIKKLLKQQQLQQLLVLHIYTYSTFYPPFLVVHIIIYNKIAVLPCFTEFCKNIYDRDIDQNLFLSFKLNIFLIHLAELMCYCFVYTDSWCIYTNT